MRLDTNGALTEAIALYRSVGYREVEPFNDNPYAHHWFEKSLRPVMRSPTRSPERRGGRGASVSASGVLEHREVAAGELDRLDAEQLHARRTAPTRA